MASALEVRYFRAHLRLSNCPGSRLVKHRLCFGFEKRKNFHVAAHCERIEEVEEFRKHHPNRPVISINVGGALQNATLAESVQEWLRYEGKIWLDESEETVATGIASDEVVERLATAPRRAKSNVKWRWVVRSVIAMLVALAIGLAIVAKVANDTAIEAIRQSQIALSRQLAAQSAAELTHDRENSLRLAMQAMDSVRSYEAEEAVTDAVLSYPHRIVLRRNTGPLWDVAFSPDGKRVVTASKDGSARYWAADTGELLAEMSGFQGPLHQVTFSPDGAFILGKGESVQVWKTKKLEPVDSDLNRNGGVSGARISPSSQATATTLGISKGVSGARFSPSGKFILTGHQDGTASVWESNTGRRVVELRGHVGWVAGAAFSPNEASVVTAGDDGVARIWSIPSGKLVGELKGHTHRLSSAEFSPEGRYVLTVASPFAINPEIESEEHRGVIMSGPLAGGHVVGTPEPDNNPRIWDLTTGKWTPIQLPPSEVVFKAAFGPGGKFVWVAMNSATMFYPSLRQVEGEPSSFSFDGSLVATIEAGRTVRIRRMDNLESVGVFPGEFALFSQDGRRILTATPDGSVSIWNMDLDRVAAGLRQSNAEFISTSFSRDGAMVATIDKDGTARLWDGSSGAEVTSTKAPDLSSQQTREAMFGNGTDILFTLDLNGHALLRNLASGKIVRLDSPFPIEHAEFSPDGSRVLTRFQKGSQPYVCNLQLWNSDTGSEVTEICLTSDEWPQARFGSDGTWIETRTASNFEIRGQIWDGHDGRHVADFPGADVSASSRLWVATFKPEGTSVSVWEASTGRLVGQLNPIQEAGTTRPSVEAMFSADGSLVMTLGQPIRIWDPATGKKSYNRKLWMRR